MHCIWQSHVSTTLSQSLSIPFQTTPPDNCSTILVNGQVKAKGLESSEDILFGSMGGQQNI
jgi:hypothetical protein